MANEPRDFLGVGWKFPIRVNARGGLSYSRHEQDIEEAVWIILSTAKRERVMQPDFGCGIHDYVFAPNNVATRGRSLTKCRSHWRNLNRGSTLPEFASSLSRKVITGC